jgi:hypothetical protein
VRASGPDAVKVRLSGSTEQDLSWKTIEGIAPDVLLHIGRAE